MSITSYPLAWPHQFPRAKKREQGHFRTSIAGALGNVQMSLSHFSRDSRKKLEDLVISSNVTLGDRRPADPGVAIWFTWDSMQICIPIDRYFTVESNLQAIHRIIEARRIELRHGTLELVRATFRGFLLAAPMGRNWWEVLGVSERASPEDIREAYRKLVLVHHPDRGGSNDFMAELNSAWQAAQSRLVSSYSVKGSNGHATRVF